MSRRRFPRLVGRIGLAVLMLAQGVLSCGAYHPTETPAAAPARAVTDVVSRPVGATAWATAGLPAAADVFPALAPTAIESPAPPAASEPSPAAQPTATESAAPQATEAPAAEGFYVIGSPVLQELYISPDGDNGNSGASRGEPLQTIGEAWSRIPGGTLSGTGYRLNLLPGTYPCEGDCINYFADRTGTYAAPIILQATDGPGTVTLVGGLNLANVGYLYLVDLTLLAGAEVGIAFGNNVLHIENGDHILLRRLTLRGPTGCISDACNDMQEVLKVNQSSAVYVEQSDLAGAYQTVLDFFSVQAGHLLANHIHRSGGRCAYLKGGSAYFRVGRNEFDDCREAGFQAGEGSNLAFMRSPWLHYEAYDIKVTNNVFHDIYGAGLSVTGGYNILLAYNTLYRIGLDDETGRPWSLVQLIHGWRGCVPADEFGGDAGTEARCQQLLNQGGWGTATLGWESGGEWIPNRNVLVLNNIFYNPPGTGTRYVQFVVNGPLAPPPWSQNLPNPSPTDAGLVIRGNIVWNAPIEDAGLVGDNNGSGNIGCQAGHPTCNPAQLQAENAINTLRPQLRNPSGGDFRLQVGSSACTAAAAAVQDFGWGDAPQQPPVPAGDLSNAVPRDRDGRFRGASGPPGAYVCVDAAKHLHLPVVRLGS